ncbi:MAG: Rnase Y domain-containing protein, partial [Gemmatimonadota bacterium]|nr:Rnase Y domain-containing protein [Gemmatimonadota bacterium]
MIAPPFLMAAGVGLVLGLLIGFGAATTRARAQQEVEKQKGLDEASRILKRAETEADNARKAGELAGREEGFRLRDAWEKEEARRREEIERSARRAAARSDASDRPLERLN